MRRRFSLEFFRIALALLVFYTSMVAWQGAFTLKVDVSLIPLDVAVYDAQGNAVKTLTREDFVVHEDGAPQEIQHFEAVDTPYKILLLFDTSGSTKGQLDFMVDASNRVLRTLRIDDQVSIASFSVGVTKLLDWRTRSGPSHQIAVPPGMGGTDLFGALEWSAGELGRVSGRKGVLVLTDGLDGKLNTPYEKAAFQQARVAVEQSRSPFYFVVVPVAAPEAIMTKARQRMSELADRSGGRVLYPRAIGDVAALYERIARELGVSYTMSYGTNRPQKDGTYRLIEVKVKQPGLRVAQSRTGYYAWAGDGLPPQQGSPLLPPQQTLVQQAPPGQGVQPPPQARPEVRVQPPGPLAPAPPAAPVPVVTNSPGLESPVLITPIDLALLPSPERESWRFDWEDIPKTSKYQIVVSAPGVAAPLIDAESRSSQYVSPARRVSNPGRNSRGWTWRVRAQTANGSWGPWSESRVFDVFVNEP